MWPRHGRRLPLAETAKRSKCKVAIQFSLLGAMQARTRPAPSSFWLAQPARSGADMIAGVVPLSF